MQEGSICYESKLGLHASSRMFVAAGSCGGGGRKGSFLQSRRSVQGGIAQRGESRFGKLPGASLRTTNKALPVRAPSTGFSCFVLELSLHHMLHSWPHFLDQLAATPIRKFHM